MSRVGTGNRSQRRKGNPESQCMEGVALRQEPAAFELDSPGMVYCNKAVISLQQEIYVYVRVYLCAQG